MFFLKRMGLRNEIKKTVLNAFPHDFNHDIELVLKSLWKNKCETILDITDTKTFILLTGEQVHLPYRIFFSDDLQSNAVLTPKQQIIYHCIFSRSCDGYVREKHIVQLLKTEIPDWCMPYILMVCSEYVVEILNDVFQELSARDNTKMIEFCKLNLKQFLYSHARMISYWDVFYRDKWYRYNDYVGKRLFSECFGYSRCLEKLR